MTDVSPALVVDATLSGRGLQPSLLVGKGPPSAKVENCQWQMLPHTVKNQRMAAFAIKTSFSDAVKAKGDMTVHLISGYRMFGKVGYS